MAFDWFCVDVPVLNPSSVAVSCWKAWLWWSEEDAFTLIGESVSNCSSVDPESVLSPPDFEPPYVWNWKYTKEKPYFHVQDQNFIIFYILFCKIFDKIKCRHIVNDNNLRKLNDLIQYNHIYRCQTRYVSDIRTCLIWEMFVLHILK